MITAVDTSILLDILGPDPVFGRRSAAALRSCLGEGRVVACEVVWAETASFFPSEAHARSSLDRLGVEFHPMSLAASLAAAVVWRAYRNAGGTRRRVAADFLIGAHATHQADRLLTRDRGFFRRYFTGLRVVDPARGRRD